MNPILNVRLPEDLQNSVVTYSAKDGYANLQDLVRSLLREYYLSKKREELLALWGSQSHVKRLPRDKVREMVAREFFEKLSPKGFKQNIALSRVSALKGSQTGKVASKKELAALARKKYL